MIVENVPDQGGRFGTAGDEDGPIPAARRGWAVFALRRGTKAGFLSRDSWCDYSTADVATVLARFAGASLNHGVDVGKSGLVVVDEDADGAFDTLCARVGIDTPATHRVRTGKGRHHYFRVRPGDAVSNAQAVDGLAVDLRGSGGYVLGAGSLHPSGALYVTENDIDPLPFPAELARKLRAKTSIDNDDVFSSPAPVGPGFTLPELMTAGTADGTPGRDEVVYRCACSFQARGLSEDEALTLVEHHVFPRIEQPPGDGFTLATALMKVRTVYAEFGSTQRDGVAIADNRANDHARKVEVKAAELRVHRDAKAMLASEDAAAFDTGPFDVGTLAEILARPAEPPFRVDGLVPADGGLLIVGQRKVGKTSFELAYARSLLTGEPFLGRFHTRPITGTVAMLNFEVSAAQLARWALDLDLDRDRLRLVNLRGVRNPLGHPAGRERLAGLLRGWGVEALIVDPFGRAYTGLNQSDNGEVGAWLSELDRFARGEVGATDVVLSAHAGWAGDHTRGASALEDWADAIVTLTRKGDAANSSRFMRALGRDVEVDEDQLQYDTSTRMRRLTGAGSRKAVAVAAKVVDLVPFVVTAITAQPGINAGDLAQAVRDAGGAGQDSAVGQAATEAVRLGHVRIEGGKQGRPKRHFPVVCATSAMTSASDVGHLGPADVVPETRENAGQTQPLPTSANPRQVKASRLRQPPLGVGGAAEVPSPSDQAGGMISEPQAPAGLAHDYRCEADGVVDLLIDQLGAEVIGRG